MTVRATLAFALLIAACAGPAHAATLFTSVYDTSPPAPHAFVIGLGVIDRGGPDGPQLHLFTTHNLYTSPPFDGSGLDFTMAAGLDFSLLGMFLSSMSFAVPSPPSPNFVYCTGGKLAPLLFTFRFSPQAVSSVPLQGAINLPTGLAVNPDGSVYVSKPLVGTWLVSKIDLATGAPSLTFGTSGPGTLTAPAALGFGPDGLLYVLDTTDRRIVAFTTVGVFQKAFALAAGTTVAPSALAIAPDGRLYTANGGGGGDVYDTVTGAHLGDYASVASNPEPDGPAAGKPLLTLDGRGFLYLYDFNTGLHVFDTRRLVGFRVDAPATAVVGADVPFTVTALDQYGNVFPGYAGTVHFTSSDLAATLPADTTLTNGTGTFTARFTTAGPKTLTATDTGTPAVTGTSDPITIAPPLFTSVHDGQGPPLDPGVSVIALGQLGSKLALFTTKTYWASPLFDGNNLTFVEQLNPSATIPLTIQSVAVPSLQPDRVYMTARLGPNVRLSTFVSNPLGSTFVPLASSVHPSGLAVHTDGSVYLSQLLSGTWSLTKIDLATGAATLTFGSTGPGTVTMPGAMAFGPGGLLYVIDTADHRIVSFTSAGVFQQAFPLVGTTAPSALAVRPDGRLYTATGYGGGDVYDTATGAHLGGFLADASFPTPGGAAAGKPVLTLDTQGYLYLYDFRTGLHVFDPRKPTHFRVEAAATAVAGAAVPVTVTALDDLDNVIVGYTGTVHFTSTDPAATLPADATLTNGTGIFNVTFRTAGARTVTATDTLAPTLTGTSPSITVAAAAASRLVVTAPAAATAGIAVAFTVTARDAFDNVATAYAGTVHFTSTDPAATLPANATLVSGTGSFNATFRTVGSRTVTATDTVSAAITGTSPSVPVSAAAATRFVVTGPAAATAGIAFAFTVTARDQFDNVATAYAGTVHFTSTDPAATLPANATLINGTGSFNATFASAGSRTVTATDTVTAAITGTSNAIAVAAVTTFTGPSATGTGPITATLAGGGPGCTFADPQLLGAPPGAPPLPPTTPGPAVAFPHGLFAFNTIGCTPGATVTITVTYPQAITGLVYWKYGPTPGDAAPHWYVLPATIAGATVTFSITDGGLGDDDLAANGTLVDQGGPGTAPAIPTLSEAMLLALALLLLAGGALRLARGGRP